MVQNSIFKLVEMRLLMAGISILYLIAIVKTLIEKQHKNVQFLVRPIAAQYRNAIIIPIAINATKTND